MYLSPGGRAVPGIVSRGTGMWVGLGMLHEASALLGRGSHDSIALARRTGWGRAVWSLADIWARTDRLLAHSGARSIRVVGRAAGLVLIEIVHVVSVLTAVADIFLASTDATEEPANTAAKSLDKVPNIHGIPDGSKTHDAALVVLKLIGNSLVVAFTQVRAWIKAMLGAVLGVGLVRKCPEMEQSKGGHLNAEQEGGDANLDVGIGEYLVGVDNVQGRGTDGNGRSLPKGEKDDELDGNNFDEELLVFEGLFELNVDLNQAEHGNSNGQGIEDNDLATGLV